MELPPGAWDAHVHCFDPKNHPFSTDRAYTPKPAKLEDLMANVVADRIMLVQASVENGYAGLLEALKRARVEYPDKVLRGTIIADHTAERNLELVTKEEFDDLHEAGVRSIRLHGIYGGNGSDLKWVQEQIHRVALLYPIQRYGWSISAQFPLPTWAALKDYILSSSELKNTVIVSDHCGCATPSQFGTPVLNDFLELLSSGKLYVKVSALHRRSPQGIDLMRPIVEAFAAHSPRRLLWGSDWPHVDASKRGLEPSDFLIGINTNKEVQLIKGWLSEEQWINMLVTNPHHLYGS